MGDKETLFSPRQTHGPFENEAIVSNLRDEKAALTIIERKRWLRLVGGLGRIAVTAVVTALIVGFICSALGQKRVADANRRAEDFREQLTQRDQQGREYLALAREAVDEFQTRVHNDPLLKERNLDLWRQSVLQKALAAYKKFVAQWGEDPDLLAELARAYGRLGKLTGAVGDKNEGIALLEQAIPIEEKLIAEYPDQLAYVVDLGGHRCELADLLRQSDKAKEATDHLDKAIQGLGFALERNPRDLTARRYLAVSHNVRGSIFHHDGKPDQSKEEFLKGAALLEKKLDDKPRLVQDAVLLSMIYANLGELRRRYGTAEEAIPWCRRAVETLEAVEIKNKPNSDLQMLLARSNYILGIAYFTNNQLDRAEESWNKALPLAQRLAGSHPGVTEYQVLLASNQTNLGVIHVRRNRFKEGEAAFTQSLEINKKLGAQNPNVIEYQAEIARANGNLADVYSAMGLHEKATDFHREAIAIKVKLAADHPTNTQYQIDLAANYRGLAMLKLRAGELEEAMAAYEQAGDVYDKSPRMADVAREEVHLAESYKDLALRYKTNHNQPQTVAAYRRMLDVLEKLAAGYPDRADFAVGLGSSYYEFAFYLNEQEKSEEALKWYAKAIQTLESLTRKDPNNSQARLYLRSSHWARGRALVLLKRPREAIPDFDQAIDLDTGVSRNALWWERTLTQARAGECEHATSEVEKRLKEKNKPAAELYQAARIFAVASVTIREDKHLTAAEQDTRADEYAARAVMVLQQIQGAGFFRNNPAAVEQMKQEADFKVLQNRQDYQKISKSIEDATAP
jgi:tetratricopeptide (TPR) repeat protein